MKKKLFLLALCSTIVSCASVRSKNAADYETNLKAPEETKSFVLSQKRVYEDPMLGVILEYTNKQYPSDNIDLYVYPIDHYSWEDKEETLSRELGKVLAEVDQAVEYGYYESRSDETKEDFAFESGENKYSGLKASFELISKHGVKYYSNAYVFTDKDKFVKFRTSFDSRATVPWNGDEAVIEILPALDVPGESEYIRELREAHRKQVTENAMNAMNAIMQALEQVKTEKMAD